MPNIKHVVGYEQFKKTLESIKGAEKIIAIFCGSKDENGQSWCPDCVKAEPVLHEAMKNLSDSAAVIECEVGPRAEWKTPDNPFRTDPHFKLTAVPTLLIIGTPKRLVEEQCMDKNLVAMVLEEDWNWFKLIQIGWNWLKLIQIDSN